MHRTALSTALLLASTPLAGAQTALDTLYGANPGDNHSVVLGGVDLDFDGTPDLIVGAPFNDQIGPEAGRAVAYSGADHGVLWVVLGNPGSWTGTSLAWTDDYDADGVPEVLVGSPYWPSSGELRGRAKVASGATGSSIYSKHGTQDLAGFGASVAGGFDWNGDGVGDFAVGAPFDDAAGLDAGRFEVFDGVTGGPLSGLNGSAGDQLGWSMTNAGDVNKNGFPDLVVGAPNATAAAGPFAGKVRVYGLVGVEIWTVWGANAGDNFGYSVAPAGDYYGDGWDDVLVGIPNWDGPNPNSGRVELYRGATGTSNRSWNGFGTDAWFGTSIAQLDDLDGDGVPEFVIGVPEGGGTQPGYAKVIGTKSGGNTLLNVFGDQPGDLFGWSVGNAGDYNGDGIGDLVVGAPGGVGPNGNAGWARVFSGGCGTALSYCTAGVSASGCQPVLAASGTPSASAPSGFLVGTLLVEGAKDGLFFFGTGGRQAASWGNGTSFQCVAPPVKRAGLLAGSGTPGVCNGSFVQDLNAHWQTKPAQNPGAGARVQLQCWYRDPLNTSSQSTSMTNALEILVCP